MHSFTLLCQQAAKLARPARADLHAHTTASDGDYTPSQVVALAREAGLVAVAITDHDTTAGIEKAMCTAQSFASKPIEVLAGVEISTEHVGRSFHLLAYFIDPTHPVLTAGLHGICERRRVRFRSYLAALAAKGLAIPAHAIAHIEQTATALGRRHLAKLLVEAGLVPRLRDAFVHHLEPCGIPSSHAVPLVDAVAWVHAAGGVASLAHPTADLTREDIAALPIDALEAEFPAATNRRRQELTRIAANLGLLVTGGSDCHGPEPVGRRIGTCGVSGDQLARLRDSAGRARHDG